MPAISLAADEGARINVQADFAFTDVDALTEYQIPRYAAEFGGADLRPAS